jgi:hypothetical protein
MILSWHMGLVQAFAAVAVVDPKGSIDLACQID